jgi:hypothetical protein
MNGRGEGGREGGREVKCNYPSEKLILNLIHINKFAKDFTVN